MVVMSVGLPSDEVAEDYKQALEDLTVNSRIEISNLTFIARETTEHALAISRVLENHIRNVSTMAFSIPAVRAACLEPHDEDIYHENTTRASLLIK